MTKIKGILGTYAMMAMTAEMLKDDNSVCLIDPRAEKPNKYPENKSTDPFDKDMMLFEYSKIQKKQSTLSANKRKFIVDYCERRFQEETKQLKS